jgi:PKD repeat protein/flagellar hook assembly protein FlgD
MRAFLVAAVLLALAVLVLSKVDVADAAGLSVSNLSPDSYFSPNGEGQNETAYVSYTLSEPAAVTITIRDAEGMLVRTVQSDTAEPEGSNLFSWNGHENNGANAPEAAFDYTISASNAGGTASASGRIGIERRLPGTITDPTPGQTVSGDFELVFAPAAGVSVTGVTFVGAGCRDPYQFPYCQASALAPEPDGVFSASLEVDEMDVGENGVYAFVYYTDPFGQTHTVVTPSVPVTVAYPEEISGLSPDSYFYPNGSGQDEVAYVGYDLLTPAKVSVVIRNGSGQVVRNVLSEAEQGPYNTGFSWDGTDNESKPAPEGVYTYTVTAVGSDGPAAVASGRIGIDRKLPGEITAPKEGATLTGSFSPVFTPTAGEDVTGVTFVASGCRYFYRSPDCQVSSLMPEPDGVFSASLEVDEMDVGENGVYAFVYYTDPFGQTHTVVTPSVPVTVAYQELELSVEASPSSGSAPLATKLKIMAKESIASPLRYAIDFGDGTVEEEGTLPASDSVTVKHTYANAGVEAAVITVFDANGNYTQQTVRVTVSASERSVPVNTLAPTISGAAREGEILTEAHGSWTGDPTSYSYQWLRCDAQGAECATIHDATRQIYTLGSEDVGHAIEVRETARNGHGAGAPATSSRTAAVVPQVPVSTEMPTISGTTVQGQTLFASTGAWTHEPTGYSYQWLRCSGADCTPISGASGDAYLLVPADVGRTIEVLVTASNAGGSSAPVISEASEEVTATPLRANAGESIAATQGVAVTLDGSGSTPAQSIVSYRWEFGDGTTASGAIVSHTYTKEGTYIATLTVSDGTSSASSATTVAVMAPPAKQVEITTVDANNQPLEGVEVLYISSDGQKIAAVSNATGRALLPGLPDGTDAFYAYKEGFQPTVGKITVDEGSGQGTISLTSGAVATSTLKDKEMDLQEIEAAGINVSDPANRNVYEFEVRLAFFPSPVRLHCDMNADGEFVGGCEFGGEGSGGGGGGGGAGGEGGDGGECTSASCEIEVEGGRVRAIPKVIEGKPLIEWLILRGKVTVLKQFTTVSLIVQDLAAEPFKLTRGSATLDLPIGLSLAPTASPQSFNEPVADVPGGGSATATWVVRGDEPGNYTLSAEYKGELEPFEAPVDISASLAEPWRVWGAEAMTLSVKADSGKLHPGVPYHVTVGVTNKADIPLYNVDLAIDSNVHANFIFQPDERFSDTIGELAPGQTLYSHKYILLPDAESVGVFNPALSSATFVGEEVHPGENIEAVTPPPLYAIEGEADTPGMIHLHWQAVPDAEGYEVFSTPNLDTPFKVTPDPAAVSADGTLSTEALSANAADAYLAGTDGATRYYAVSALVEGHPTLESPAIADSAGGGLPEFGRCVSEAPVKEGSKTVYKGDYTESKCTKASSAKAGKYEWLGGPGTDRGFTGTEGAMTLETVDKVKIKCSAGQATGTYATARTESLTIAFTGCELAVPKVSCQSEGARAGEVKSSVLEAELGFIKGGSKPSVGLSLEPVAPDADLASFKCGEASLAVSGSAIAPVTAVDQMVKAFTSKYLASKGKQSSEHFEGGLNDTLDLTIAGKPEERLGLTATEKEVPEEALEIKALE